MSDKEELERLMKALNVGEDERARGMYLADRTLVYRASELARVPLKYVTRLQQAIADIWAFEKAQGIHTAEKMPEEFTGISDSLLENLRARQQGLKKESASAKLARDLAAREAELTAEEARKVALIQKRMAADREKQRAKADEKRAAEAKARQEKRAYDQEKGRSAWAQSAKDPDVPLPKDAIPPPRQLIEVKTRLPASLRAMLPPDAKIYIVDGTNVQYGRPNQVFFPRNDLSRSRVSIVAEVMAMPSDKLPDAIPPSAMDFSFAYLPADVKVRLDYKDTDGQVRPEYVLGRVRLSFWLCYADARIKFGCKHGMKCYFRHLSLQPHECAAIRRSGPTGVEFLRLYSETAAEREKLIANNQMAKWWKPHGPGLPIAPAEPTTDAEKAKLAAWQTEFQQRRASKDASGPPAHTKSRGGASGGRSSGAPADNTRGGVICGSASGRGDHANTRGGAASKPAKPKKVYEDEFDFSTDEEDTFENRAKYAKDA